MPDSRRYVFHGHAAALGGRIVRMGQDKGARIVKDGFIDLPASALTVAGGRSTARIDPSQLTHPDVKKIVRFEKATAFSEGIFDDVKGHFAVTQGQREESTLTATTTVRAEVLGLQVGLQGDGNVRMVINGVRAGFTSRSGSAGGETPVQLEKDTGFDGNVVTFIDEKGKPFTLVVDIERDVFFEHDTFSGLTAAAGASKFLRKFGHTLHLSSLAGSKQLPTAPPLIRTDGGAVQGTIVKPIAWKGAAFPESRIDPDRPNNVFIPGLGTIFFGEITIARQSRRLTMVRGKLGSPFGGHLAAVDVQDNGGLSL